MSICRTSLTAGQARERHRGPTAPLSLRFDLVPEHQVSQEPQDDKEDAQDEEVQVELGLLHIQLLQDLDGFLERAEVLEALQVLALHGVDGEDDPLEAIPRAEHTPRVTGAQGSQDRELWPELGAHLT